MALHNMLEAEFVHNLTDQELSTWLIGGVRRRTFVFDLKQAARWGKGLIDKSPPILFETVSFDDPSGDEFVILGSCRHDESSWAVTIFLSLSTRKGKIQFAKKLEPPHTHRP